jgi:hypothetical protein
MCPRRCGRKILRQVKVSKHHLAKGSRALEKGVPPYPEGLSLFVANLPLAFDNTTPPSTSPLCKQTTTPSFCCGCSSYYHHPSNAVPPFHQSCSGTAYLNHFPTTYPSTETFDSYISEPLIRSSALSPEALNFNLPVIGDTEDQGVIKERRKATERRW